MRYDDDDDDDEVKDGESVRTPLYLCDAVTYDEDGEPHFVRASAGVDLSRHQPGYRSVGDAASKSTHCGDLDALRDAARSARSSWIRKISDAWKTQVAGSEGQRRTNPSEINQSALSERRVGHEPDNSSSLAEWREHSGGPDDEPEHDLDAAMRRHQRTRDLAWSRFRDDLQNKWRTGADPTAATRIEKERERYLGKFER
jgi:hypothetical protein